MQKSSHCINREGPLVLVLRIFTPFKHLGTRLLFELAPGNPMSDWNMCSLVEQFFIGLFLSCITRFLDFMFSFFSLLWFHL